MQGKCKLCEQESDLQESHIIPKFIFKHLKETSPTGKLRQVVNVNKRKQDGIKLHWLCKSCEAKFNKLETYFSKKIYHPLHDGQHPIQYDNRFLKFCVSISWRVLKYIIESGHISHLSNEITIKMNTGLDEWRKFLLDKNSNPGIYEQHFYNFTGNIEQSTLPMSTNIHRYLQRSIAIDVINRGPQAIIVYTKFPSLLLIGFINIENLGTFRDTRIHVKNGLLDHQKLIFPEKLWEYIQANADITKNAKQSISDRQKEKIKSDYENIPHEKIITTGTFQSLQKDVDLFGLEDVFKAPDKTEK